MEHKILMRWSKGERDIVWKYNSHKTKHLGYGIYKVLEKRFKDNYINVDEYTSIKLKLTFDDKSD